MVQVADNDDTWPVQRDSVALDPYSGAVTERVAWADYPFLAKLTSIGILAHMGLLFGLPNQLALAALAIGLLCGASCSGATGWRGCAGRPGTGRPGERFAPAPRGTFRALSQPVGFAVVLVTVAAGWLMPVFGVSLPAFLVIDALLGRRRTPA